MATILVRTQFGTLDYGELRFSRHMAWKLAILEMALLRDGLRSIWDGPAIFQIL
jgi:hypothetical protein